MATLGEFIPSSSTKLLLHLNGNSNDSSSSGNNGTDTAITYSQANGKFGQGAGFVRTSPSYITFSGAGTSMSFSGDFTLMAWVKLASTNGGGNLLTKATNNGASSNNYELLVFPNYIQLAGNGGKYATTASLSELTVSVWHHVCVVKTGTGTVTIYLNGLQRAESYPSGAITFGTNTTQPYFGRRDDGAGNGYYNGEADEVIAENRAWSASEVKKYYTYAKGQFGII